MGKIQLHGFNNLTKCLSLNIYDVCYATTREQRSEYIRYIDEEYRAERLTAILTEVTHMIGATILNIAYQDYEPQGASATVLIAEDEVLPAIQSDLIVGHLDKSHITIHTYPETHPQHDVSTFRVDIEVSTCGYVSPLKALDYLVQSFESDIVILDYRIRGFTRDVDGNKHYNDSPLNSILDYMAPELAEQYDKIDMNIYEEKIFHTKMMIKELELDGYLFGIVEDDLPLLQKEEIRQQLRSEMREIFYGKNLSDPQLRLARNN